MKTQKPEKKKLYLCGVAWQHEIGETDARLYRSLSELVDSTSCSDGCGVVEIEMTARWVVKQDFEKMVKSSKKINAKRKIQR